MMIPKQKRFSMILFTISLVLFFFSSILDVHAAEIHSFSINNEGKYFIYYWEGADLSKVKAIRNEAIRIIPPAEKWSGMSFGTLEINIAPDDFAKYQAVYGGTDVEKFHQFGFLKKGKYDNVIAVADAAHKEILIKESASVSVIYHEISHLAQYPFSGYGSYFDEGQANNGAQFIAHQLGINYDNLFARIHEQYNSFPPEERMIYGRNANALHPETFNATLTYPVGSVFIEKILEKAQVQDLSAFFINMRDDFSDVVTQYPNPNSFYSFIALNGQEIFPFDFGSIHLSSLTSQEVVQCEMIKTYGDKVAPVFAEFGFPSATNCDVKISAFKQEKLKEAASELDRIKTGTYIQHERIGPLATEQDPFAGSELIENKKSESTGVSQGNENADSLPTTSANEKTSSGPNTSSDDMVLIYTVSIGLLILTGIAAYFIKKTKIKQIGN